MLTLRSRILPAFILRVTQAWSCTLLMAFFTLGCLFTFFVPPFQVPDENAHWYAGYQRTEQLFNPFYSPAEYCLYANSLPDHFETGRIAFHADQKINGTFYKSLGQVKRHCLHFILTYGYVGTYPGLVTARLIAQRENERPDRTFQVFLLSRLLQGLLVCGSLARLLYLLKQERIIVPGILTLSALMLSPLMIQQSFGLSADTIMIALCIYLITAVFAWRRLTVIDLVCLLYLAVSNGLTKPPQIGVIPVALFAGWLIHHLNAKEEAKSKDTAHLWSSIGIFVATLVVSIWMTTQDHRPPVHQVMGRDLDIGRQLAHVMANPLQVCSLFHRTLMSYLDFKLLSGPLGWLDTPIREWTRGYWREFLRISLYLDIAVGILLFCIPYQNRLSWPKRFLSMLSPLLVLAAAYISALLVILTLYITWTPVGADGVHGLQGRYFLPFLILVPAMIGGILTSLRGGNTVTIEGTAPSNRAMVSVTFLTALIAGSLSLCYVTTLFTDLVRRWW